MTSAETNAQIALDIDNKFEFGQSMGVIKMTITMLMNEIEELRNVKQFTPNGGAKCNTVS